jgi:hypothetical protein
VILAGSRPNTEGESVMRGDLVFLQWSGRHSDHCHTGRNGLCDDRARADDGPRSNGCARNDYCADADQRAFFDNDFSSHVCAGCDMDTTADITMVIHCTTRVEDNVGFDH